MREFLLFSTTLTLCVQGGVAYAGDCRDTSQYAAILVEAAKNVCEENQGRFKSCKFAALQDQVDYWTKWWNKMVGNNWATLGPRQLPYNARTPGTIINPGVRTFVSMAPAAGKGKVEIKIWDGSAGVDVSYCALKSDGTIEFLGIDRVSSGQSPPIKDLTEQQIGGRFVIVKLDGTGGAGKRYQYNITLSGSIAR